MDIENITTISWIAIALARRALRLSKVNGKHEYE